MFTKKWLMAIPRRRKNAENKKIMCINALGCLGGLFIRDKEIINDVIKTGF